MSIRLRPTNPVASEAILVGDPGRALALAQSLLVDPKMSNHARGLWGYTSTTPEGTQLTVQSTGMGGPSAAAVISDLVSLGVRRAVRVGTCRSLGASRPGEPVAITLARPLDGTPAAGPGDRPDGERSAVAGIEPPGAALTEKLGDRLGRRAAVMCLYEDPAREPQGVLTALRDSAAPDCDVADMQTAALFVTGRRLAIEVGATLVPEWSAAGERLEPGRLEAAIDEAARAALGALEALAAISKLQVKG